MFFRFINNQFFLILIVVLFLINAVFRISFIPSSSMEPTIMTGDVIIVTKYHYGFKKSSLAPQILFNSIVPNFSFFSSAPKRGDIIVFWSDDESAYIVKRVIGVPGDKISMNNGRLTINDNPLNYEYKEITQKGIIYNVSINNKRFTILKSSKNNSWDYIMNYMIPNDRFYVMGDNNDNSKDSRFFGTVEESYIVGKPSAVLFTLSWKFPYISFHRTGLYTIQ